MRLWLSLVSIILFILTCFIIMLVISVQVPNSLDQSEDEGFQSSSNLTPDSQSEPSPSPELDLWEALRTFEPGKRRCWESVGWYVTCRLFCRKIEIMK